MRKKKEPTGLSSMHEDWHAVAIRVLGMRNAGTAARQVARHCLRQCLTQNHDDVVAMSLESIALFRSGGKPERDHVLPVQMAAETLTQYTTLRQWHALIDKHRTVCLVTRAENHRLKSVPFSEDWRARYKEAGIEIVSYEEYMVNHQRQTLDDLARILRQEAA